MKVEYNTVDKKSGMSMARLHAVQKAASIVRPETIFDRSTALFDVWDVDTHRYVYVSEAVRSITGFAPEDYLGRGREFLISRLHPDDLDVVDKINTAREAIEVYKPGMDDTKPFVSFEFRVRHKDGHYVWIHADSTVYSRKPDGRLQYVVSTGVRIDEQKAYEEKLKKAARLLEESQARLQEEHEQLLAVDNAKDEFVSIASHQLRTPASGVKQYIGLLLQDYVGPITEEQRQVLQAANECNDRQMQIVDDLLSIAKLNAGKVQLHRADTDLDMLVAGVAEEQDVKAKAREQRVNFQCDGHTEIDVSIDSFLIRMVLENLIDNARKYSSAGSDVEVRLSTQKDNVTVEVQDHGVGIAKQDRHKLFKKFSRIQNDDTSKISGTGLGLYWAKEIMDMHGGSLRLVSSSKSGSTFSFTLPLPHPTN